MSPLISTLREAVLAAAGAIPGAGPAEAVHGTAAAELGTVTDGTGEELRVFRTPNGSVLMLGDSGTALGFSPGQAAALRELLDRAGMPGQEA